MAKTRTPSTRRINRGKGHSYVLDGEPVIGVTHALSEGFPKPGLIGWAAEETAKYAVGHWAELQALGEIDRFQQLVKARFESRDTAAIRGTAVHSYAARYLSGDEIEPPEELADHVERYIEFVRDWDVREQLVEVTIVNRGEGYMGTLDLVVELADGKTWLLDYKTSGKGVYSDTALQLAAYRNAETYIDDDDVERPMPEVERCGVLWLRADGYDVVPLEVGEREYRTFLHVLEVARWRKDDREVGVVGDAMTLDGKG
jgi:hypothetical protein